LQAVSSSDNFRDDSMAASVNRLQIKALETVFSKAAAQSTRDITPYDQRCFLKIKIKIFS
jgi:hypothetical protein